ncbi:MAG TPA: 3'(2'),5'-bisphosphate nucleotidase CysQ [Rhizomicrobium sp.]|nr:3'(2'),5'-bisphosphate nucleotidase CysQ [Rhizomicrobium sp.]
MSATMPDGLMTLARIAVKAGRVVMRHYEAGAEARIKHDHSPVTDADEEAEALILAELDSAFPGVPVIAEEEAARGRIAGVGARFFLVDPLDGTKEFLKRNGEFTVNIGEIADEQPVAGVVYAPALGRLFAGAAGHGAFEADAGLAHIRPISARTRPDDGLVVVASRSHRNVQTDTFLSSMKVREFRTAGSSLKFCLLAAGEADLYPRTGPTMEWDTAAGHAVLRAAGGEVTNWDGSPFLYGKHGFANPGFVARGRDG